MSKIGTLYIFAAPSGGGKTSLVNALLKNFDGLQLSISYTTRPPRPQEEEGVSYHFVDDSTFQQMIAEEKFLEYAKVFGHWYGTSKQWISDQLDQGTDIILEIDWQGARQVCQQFSQTVTVFIMPPSYDTLKQRLEGRHQDEEVVIEQRMAQAVSEMSHFHEFDYLVINDDFDVALDDLKSIVHARRLRRVYQQVAKADLIQDLMERR